MKKQDGCVYFLSQRYTGAETTEEMEKHNKQQLGKS